MGSAMMSSSSTFDYSSSGAVEGWGDGEPVLALLSRITELSWRQKVYNDQMAAHFPPGSNVYDSPWWSWWCNAKGVVWSDLRRESVSTSGVVVAGSASTTVAFSGNPVPMLASAFAVGVFHYFLVRLII